MSSVFHATYRFFPEFKLKLILLLLFVLAIEISFSNSIYTELVAQAFIHQPSFKNTIDLSGISKQPSFGGAAWADYDNDGYQDLFFADKGGTLYHNNQNGTFTDVTSKSGIDKYSAAFGASFGDYDNDNCLDLYISLADSSSDVLYHNNCNGTFTNVTKKAGIHNPHRGTGVAWADYNHDGFLDIYVANYGSWSSKDNWTYEPNILYLNNGDGTFTDVALKAGVAGKARCTNEQPFPKYPQTSHKTYSPPQIEPWKESYQPIWFDYDNDGWPDLFITSDDGVSPLYHNNGNGTFTDVTEKAGMCVRSGGMGVSAGDYNRDGYLDLYVTNGDRNFLWKNNRNGTFSEVSEETGTANFGSLGWGAGFLDYDNDGYLDIYAVGGTVFRDKATRKRFFNRHDRLLKNNGHDLFSDVASTEGLSGNDPKLTAAFADYNNDGFTDIFVVSDFVRRTEDTGYNRLYTNDPNGNHWLTIQLHGTKSNRSGVGARITIKTESSSQIREVETGSSYIAENSLWANFGLGTEKTVRNIVINWPSGVTQNLTNIKTNQKIIVVETDRSK